MSRTSIIFTLILIAVITATCGTPQPGTKDSLVLESMLRVVIATDSGL